MQLLAPEAQKRDEVGPFERREMLGDRLTRDAEPAVKLDQRPPVARLQKVQQAAAVRLGQGVEDGVIIIHL